MSKVRVLYCSPYGQIEAMAKAVAEAAREAGGQGALSGPSHRRSGEKAARLSVATTTTIPGRRQDE